MKKVTYQTQVRRIIIAIILFVELSIAVGVLITNQQYHQNIGINIFLAGLGLVLVGVVLVGLISVCVRIYNFFKRLLFKSHEGNHTTEGVNRGN